MTMLQTATESVLHRQVCEYLKLQYPNVIFNSDGAGNNLSRTQRGINTMLRSGRGYPDLFIAEPRGEYHGMFLELKKEGTRLYLKDDETPANAHIAQQLAMLERLNERGYYARFGVGWLLSKAQIDGYLHGSS